MICAMKAGGKLGPGKIEGERVMYSIQTGCEEIALEYHLLDSSIDGSGYVDSAYQRNCKKWLAENPEIIVLFKLFQ